MIYATSQVSKLIIDNYINYSNNATLSVAFATTDAKGLAVNVYFLVDSAR
jgi:hypothetical protein